MATKAEIMELSTAERLAIPAAFVDPAFQHCLVEPSGNLELAENFDRLTGCRVGRIASASAIEKKVDDAMPLREVCNKIIHALAVEPHLTDAMDAHHLDDLANEFACPEDGEHDRSIQWDPVKWSHLTGNIRLVGKKGKETWYHLLEVSVFIDAITSLLRD